MLVVMFPCTIQEMLQKVWKVVYSTLFDWHFYGTIYGESNHKVNQEKKNTGKLIQRFRWVSGVQYDGGLKKNY